MTDGPNPEKVDWDELSRISREARLTGLILYYNDFSAPVARHNSLGGEGNHCFGLVLTVAEEEACLAHHAAIGMTTDILRHPRTRWAPTPKLALIASLAILEVQPKQ